MLNNFWGECLGQSFYIEGSVGITLHGYQDPYYGFPYGKGFMEEADEYNYSGAIGLNVYKSQIYLELGYSSLFAPNELIIGSDLFGPDDAEAKLSFNRKRFIPAIKYVFFNNDRKYFYLKAGMTIDLKGVVANDELTGTPDNPGNGSYDHYDVYYIETITQNNYSFGYMISVGLEIKLFNHLCFFWDNSYGQEKWSPSKSEVTYSSTTSLSNLPLSQKESDFTGNEQYMQYSYSISNTPTIQPKFTYILGTFNMNVGLKINFGKVKTDAK
jgi:hypothetical protein